MLGLSVLNTKHFSDAALLTLDRHSRMMTMHALLQPTLPTMHVFLLKGLLNEPGAIQRFSKEYIVKDHLVKNYVCHLEDLKFKKKKT